METKEELQNEILRKDIIIKELRNKVKALLIELDDKYREIDNLEAENDGKQKI
jgi:hypothetical protein